MVREIAESCKSVFEMSYELRPNWEGYLLLDEKMISVRGNQQWFYCAVDGTGDIVHCRPVPELTSTEAMKFINEVIVGLEYNCRGVTTDFDSSLTIAVEKILAGKPHQMCLKHAFSILDNAIGYKPYARRRRWNITTLKTDFEKLRDKKGIWVEKARKDFMEVYKEHQVLSLHHNNLLELRKSLHQILFARSRVKAKKRFNELRHRCMPSSVAVQKQKAVNFLKRYWDKLMVYHYNYGMPRTTNLVENVNKQIERRMKTIESFQSKKGAADYMNLLIAYLRQKPYTDCRGKRKRLNGRSRLECAGVHLETKDWLKNSISK